MIGQKNTMHVEKGTRMKIKGFMVRYAIQAELIRAMDENRDPKWNMIDATDRIMTVIEKEEEMTKEAVSRATPSIIAANLVNDDKSNE